MPKETMVISAGPYGDYIGPKPTNGGINVVTEISPEEQIKVAKLIGKDHSVPKTLRDACLLTLQRGSVPKDTINSGMEGIATYIFNHLRQLRTPKTSSSK